MALVIKAPAGAAPRCVVLSARRGSTDRCSTRCGGLFGIQPDMDLAVMTQDQSLAAVTARIMEGLDPVIQQTRSRTGSWRRATRRRCSAPVDIWRTTTA